MTHDAPTQHRSTKRRSWKRCCRNIGGLGALLTLLACTPRGAAPQRSSASTPGHSATAGASATPSSPSPRAILVPAKPPPAASITDPEVLSLLQSSGFDFGRVALGIETETLVSTRDYARTPPYRTLLQTLSNDLAETQARDRHLGIGMRYAHRLFDASWLSSPKFHFELVGIVNRIDRRVFAASTCGEIRFIYRLAYRTEVSGQVITSRVPMTANVVRWLPRDDTRCEAWASRWQFDAADAALAKTLSTEGQLLHELLDRTQPKSVEVNLQSVRWPSTVRPNMAGHAEYLLRVFEPTLDSGGSVQGFTAAALENTIDVDLLLRSKERREAFVEWLGRPEVLAAIDQGTVLVPDEYLATRAVSVAPHGLARHGNRPYRRALRDADLAALEWGGRTTFSDPASLLRRLDGLSCQGCHQTRSVAGFHFLGEDDTAREADAIGVAHSAHFTDELVRRGAYLGALVSGQSANDFRAPSERMREGSYAAHCGLDAEGPFAAWDCTPGFHCVRVNDAEVGQCQPVSASAGDACELGSISPNADSHRDFVRLERARQCGDGAVCERNGVGFPGGMCSSRCAGLNDDEVCGGIAQLVEFNACLATQTPFQRCILNHTRPGALRRCSTSAPCREDYVCARLANGEGGCIPPYFLFQLRVDGHVLE